MIAHSVLTYFGQNSGPVEELKGGTRPVFRAGDICLKQLHETSFESENSLQLAPWLADQLSTIPENGFRLAYPVRGSDSQWMTSDGWAAWSFLKGAPAEAADLPQVIAATTSLLTALQRIEKHPLLDSNSTPWGVAHRACLQLTPPEDVHPVLRSLVEEHFKKIRPVTVEPMQLIHGDLNLGNVMVAPGHAPGFLDFTPFWGPPRLCLAILANWAGPRTGDASVLKHFESVPDFDQWILRASIRMLIVVSEWKGVENWDASSEKRAAEIVLECVG